MILKDNVLNLNYDLVETDCYKTLPHYNYWRGWWNEKPRNIIEIVIKQLWENYIDVDKCKEGGFEYWGRTLDKGGHLEWHQDTGEYNYFNENYWCSDKSLLYYPKVSDDCIGGFLELAPYKLRGTLKQSQTAGRQVNTNEVERIKPVTDRMVFFDSARLHRVTPVYSGVRYNLATAFWSKTPQFFNEHENWYNLGVGQKLQKGDWINKYDTKI